MKKQLEIEEYQTVDFERKLEETVVKTLDLWEKENITNMELDSPLKTERPGYRLDTEGNSIEIRRSKEKKTMKEWENMVYMEKLKNSMTNSNFPSISKHLTNFYEKHEKEQCCIFFQNINIAKRKFNFNRFVQGEMEATDNSFDEELLKAHNINPSAMSKELLETDTYREMIRAKEKMENNYRKE